ncbi:hypothetical protein BCR42DRAFT_487339 [Absidia repens]|uniref:Uncharacterized protein n=1 Tax=Absidia repens TaxID=90262 RepID=A0A1X2IWE4_9FUNG|nr:hypothetical protein BCR42DRAFT_487339 [Absidia repens]
MNVDADFLDGFQTMTSTIRQFPSCELKDIKGHKIDVKQLAQEYRLILITFKSASCLVCPQLLHILNMYGLVSDCTTYEDPFTLEEWEIDEPTKKFFRLLLQKDAYFIVLCPGADDQVAQIQNKTNFNYPFIASEQAISLGKALKMNMSDDELWPATMEVTKDTLDVTPIYIGRSAGHYYHQYLLKLLVRERGRCEMKGVIAMREAYDTVDRLKRKIIKCEKKSMATWILTLSSTKTKKNAAPSLATSPTSPSPTVSSTSSLTSTTNSSTVVVSQASTNTNATTPTHISPSPSLSSVNTSTTTTTTDSPTKSTNHLPPELLELALSFIDNTSTLVSITRVSRLYFITVCNILVKRLRSKMETLRLALPQGDNGECLVDETDVFNKFVNRWGESDQGIGYRDLERRVIDLVQLVDDIGKWTRCWSPRRKLMTDHHHHHHHRSSSSSSSFSAVSTIPHLRMMRDPHDESVGLF